MRVVLVTLWCMALWGLFKALDPAPPCPPAQVTAGAVQHAPIGRPEGPTFLVPPVDYGHGAPLPLPARGAFGRPVR